MCQIRAVLEHEGQQETLMEGVTGLEIVDDNIVLTTFFEEPKTVHNARISKIDFLGGSLVLKPCDPKGAVE